MAELNIVLVEPEIPQNTGNIARTCACTGARLHIVKPMGFTVTDKHLKRSGLDYWQYLDLTYYENLDDFFEKHPDAACYFFTTKAVHRHSDPVYPDKAYLFFGKETAGLGVYEVLRQWDYPELQCSGELHRYRWTDANDL